MNLLIDNIDDVVYKKIQTKDFCTDFRASIRFELIMQNPHIEQEDKLLQILEIFYSNPQTIIEIGLEKAIDNILWFYKCGQEDKNLDKNDEEENEKGKQIYSYEFDDKYIYDAFLDQYNINLQKIKYLHWWEFKAMFDGLKEDNEIIKIMGYRAINISKIKDKEEKKRYQKLKKQYALPDMRTEEEKEQDFAENMWH